MSGGVSPTFGRFFSSRHKYHMPAPKMVTYTAAQPASDVATVLACSPGVTASRVRSRPWMTQGWRPISVTYQPASSATKPEPLSSCQPRSVHTERSSRPRHQSHAEASTTSSISVPRPTITRKA